MTIEKGDIQPVIESVMKAGEEMGYKVRDPNMDGPITEGGYSAVLTSLMTSVFYANYYSLYVICERMCLSDLFMQVLLLWTFTKRTGQDLMLIMDLFNQSLIDRHLLFGNMPSSKR